MNKTILILLAFAFTTINPVNTPFALAKINCPDGAIWDQSAKKCVDDEIDDPEEGGEGSM